jgi:hypothetical protein
MKEFYHGGIIMNLSEYFEAKEGFGVLATADKNGKVNTAVYARPHFINEETIAFIMLERLTYKNLQSNSHASYLFRESGDKYAGKRLYLTKTKEEENTEMIDCLRRKEYEGNARRHLVYFRIDKILPLIGTGEKN